LPAGLRDHVERVRTVARELAERHGYPLPEVDFAAAAHDLMRAESDDALLALAEEYGVEVDPVEASTPMLLHGPVAAAWLESRRLTSAPEVLAAVRWHTTGHPDFGGFETLVYLADKLEPGKRSRYPWQEEARSLVEAGLDRAALCFVENQIQYLQAKGLTAHPHSVDYREALARRTG
jgi:predicted HD superfamily hydrolase involved in NAD metabolism